MSGLFGSITIRGNRLTEFGGTTATVGTPIPFGYGAYQCDGNVIFAALPPKEHVTKKKQGKGGVKTEEYTYTMSYAVAFCAGPIFGFLTIKRNGKVVYTTDPNAKVEDRVYAARWARKATFYYGTETQLPDSTIEAYKGAGKVSAFRGIAYIVVEDDDVTAEAGSVPQYEAIVLASSELNVTTPPYSLEVIEQFYSTPAYRAGSVINNLVTDNFKASASFVSAAIHADILFRNVEAEVFNSGGSFQNALIKTELHYASAGSDSFNSGAAYQSSAIAQELIYHTQPFEQFNSAATFVEALIQ